MKSSKIAIKMLERLLTAGFEKDVSMKLINSTLSANTSEDMFATLDIQILDLFNGNMEFIKIVHVLRTLKEMEKYNY